MKEAKENLFSIFGLISLGLAFLSPLAGIVLGIISLNQIKKQNKGDFILAKRLSIWAIVVALIVFLIQIILLYTNTGGFLA